MNDKEFAKWREERWQPFCDWKGEINMRVARLEVRTKLALAKSAYFKARAEMRALQVAAAGRRGGAPMRAAPDGRVGNEVGGRRRRRASASARQANKQ